MKFFYPRIGFINFYIVPLMIEPRDSHSRGRSPRNAAAAIAATGEQVGHAIILRDITESRRSAQQTSRVRAIKRAHLARRRRGARELATL